MASRTSFAIRGVLASLETLSGVSVQFAIMHLISLLGHKFGYDKVQAACKAIDEATEKDRVARGHNPTVAKVAAFALNAADKLMCVVFGQSQKLNVIKNVRARSGEGLLEAKNLVETYLPYTGIVQVHDGINFLSVAEKDQLRAAGFRQIVTDYEKRQVAFEQRVLAEYEKNNAAK